MECNQGKEELTEDFHGLQIPPRLRTNPKALRRLNRIPRLRSFVFKVLEFPDYGQTEFHLVTFDDDDDILIEPGSPHGIFFHGNRGISCTVVY